MSDNQPDPRRTAVTVMDYLRRFKDDRGAMADLRRALNPAQRHRAWPLLGRVGGIGNSRIEVIAGLFAYHPDETHEGNLGTTCPPPQAGEQQLRGSLHPVAGLRLRRDLRPAAPVILAAKAKGIVVNYERLFTDLSYWGDRVKADWAREYWGVPRMEEPPSPSRSEPAP